MVTKASQKAPKPPKDRMPCPKCILTFSNAGAFDMHLRRKHGVEKNRANAMAVIAWHAMAARKAK